MKLRFECGKLIFMKYLKNVKNSAIAPYGSNIDMYNQIAGPSHRLDSRKTSDAGLDIDADAIRTLQVSDVLFICPQIVYRAV